MTRCFSFFAAVIATSLASAADWPQWMGPNRDDVWAETGIVETFPGGGPQGSVAKADQRRIRRPGRRRRQGLRHRLFEGRPATPSRRRPSATTLQGKERVLCLDAQDRRRALEARVRLRLHDQLSGRPALHADRRRGQGRIRLGAMGDLVCLDAETGSVIWSKNLPKEYGAPVPLWGYCGPSAGLQEPADLHRRRRGERASSRSTSRPARKCGRRSARRRSVTARRRSSKPAASRSCSSSTATASTV